MSNFEARPATPPNRRKQVFNVVQTGEVNGNRAERDYDDRPERPESQRGPRKPQRQDARRERPVRTERVAVKTFSHDDLIASWKGKRIVIGELCGAINVGTLIDADKFAIVVEVKDVGPIVVFKHSLGSITQARDE